MTTRGIWEQRWTLVLAMLTGLVLSPVFRWSPLLPLYDAYHPVVQMRGDLVLRDGDAVVVHVWGTKHRDCAYVGIRAYGSKNGVLVDANIARVGLPMTGTTRPMGTFDIGQWRVWPVDKADLVVIFVQHICDGRAISTRIAEIDI